MLEDEKKTALQALSVLSSAPCPRVRNEGTHLDRPNEAQDGSCVSFPSRAKPNECQAAMDFEQGLPERSASRALDAFAGVLSPI